MKYNNRFFCALSCVSKKYFLWFYINAFFLFGCSSDNYEDTPLCFIGDSQIENWDTEFYFPNRITKNYGKDGAGIDYLVGLNSIVEDADVIIEIGTNDINVKWDERQIEEYADLFFVTLQSVQGRNKYVMDVFPTSDRMKNNIIKTFNDKLFELICLHEKDSNIQLVRLFDFLEDDGVIKDDITRDGVHLNDFGYRIVADKIRDCL